MPEPTNRYGPTAARQHGRPAREIRPPNSTIGIHAHMAIDAAATFAGPHVSADPRGHCYTNGPHF